MALRRYRHTSPAPLEVNAVNTTALTTVGLTTTGTSGPVNFPEQVGIVKEFQNDVEDFIVRPTALAAWRGGISWTRSTGTSQRGLRIMTWDNNGVRNNLFSIWDGRVGIGSGLNSVGNYVGPRSKLHVGEDLHLGGTDAAFVTIKQPGGANTDGLYIERSGEQKGYYMYVNPAKADSLVFTRNNDGTKADAFEISRTGNVTVTTGNLIIGTAGQGIDFSANANAAGMTSELLSDYEVGTWTPTLVSRSSPSGSLNYTNNTGRYVKIGDFVFVTAFMTWNGGSIGGSTVQLSGLPFASGPNNTRGGFQISYSASGWITGATIYQQAFRNETNETNAIYNFSDATDGKIDTVVNGSQVSSTGELMLSGCYPIS